MMRAPRKIHPARRPPSARRFDPSDATIEPDPGPPPEVVFDRVTGPYRRGHASGPGAVDEET
jgi:hypothetical protein